VPIDGHLVIHIIYLNDLSQMLFNPFPFEGVIHEELQEYLTALQTYTLFLALYT